LFPSLDEAIARMVVVRDRYQPDPVNRAVYDAGYATYRRLYDDLVGLFDRPAGMDQEVPTAAGAGSG
jgi:sugar (pentulose or hexulose) kinase